MAIWPDDEALATLLKSRHRRELPEEKGIQPSAVLVPLFQREAEPYLLLTRRSEDVSTHKGQICFPGGRAHPEDASLRETALREGREEIGLAPQDVRVLGALDDVQTLGLYRITPFLARIPHPYVFQPQPGEVAEILEIPLARFQDPARFETRLFPQPSGQPRPVYFYDVGNLIVWGATARIIKEWLDLLAPRVP